MSKSMWTEYQLQAINYEGSNVLVSAGAGSGKTAVLTERLLRKLKSGVSLKNLIVLTFTSAAASEMKERLRKKLQDEIKDGNLKLQNELEYIDQSNIQTFDAFSLYLVKKYHYLLGIPKTIDIGDSSLFILERKRIIDEVFDEFYSNNEFNNFISKYSVKNDESVKKYVSEVLLKLDICINKEEIINSEFSNYYNDEFINAKVKEYLDLINKDREKLAVLIKELEDKITEDKLVELVDEMRYCIDFLLKATSYEDIRDCCYFTLPLTPRKADNLDEKEFFQNYRKKIKEVIDEILEKCCYENTNEMIREIKETRIDVSIFSKVLKRIDSKLNAFKKEKNIYDFSDIAKMAIKLMVENVGIRNEYKKSINEILVDEYQDTSDIQETLVSLISNNNVYMVGDIKQSIYRFRNANPTIFENKYISYSKNVNGKLINLDKNFRSREEVLNNINHIFEKVMSQDIGGADYSKGHALRFGNTTYSNYKSENNNMEVLDYTIDVDCKYKPKEVEIVMIAKDIISKINSNYQVYDRSINGLRKVNYSDFAILTQDKGSYDIYKKVFDFYDIPLIIHKDTSFIESDEIIVIKNILKSIYSLLNKEYYKDNFRYSFLSLIRSFVSGYSDDEIFSCFSENKYYYFKEYNTLKELASLAESITLGELMEEVYKEFKIYQKLYLLDDVNSREDRVNYLLEQGYKYSRLGYGLFDFIEYLDEISNTSKLDIQFKQNHSLKGDYCNLMTIHKSKGLEFNICYFPELNKKFNYQELNERIIFDNRFGLIMPCFNEGVKETFYKKLLKHKTRVEEIGERIRIFYVALTRAKDKMIILNPNNPSKINKYNIVPYYEKIKFNNFSDMLNLIPLNDYTNSINILPFHNDYNKKREKFNNVLMDEVNRYNVSLTGEKKVSRKASTSINDLLDKETKDKLEFGTLVHSYMERIDSVNDLNEDTLEIVRKAIAKFFSHDVFKKEIIERYHEYEFVYYEGSTKCNGIIDLLLETNDEFIVIDYKLKDIDKESYVSQINEYKKYISKISDKKVSGYLYSIILDTWKEI